MRRLTHSKRELDPIKPRPTFSSRSEFWRDLKGAARDHLAAEERQGRPAIGDPRLKRKAATVLIWFGASFAGLLCAPTIYNALLATMSLAVAAAALGFGVFHDANHGTLFRRPWANLAAARLCSVLLGPSRHLWVHKHHGLHHRQPNVIGWDDDLETRGFLRFSPAAAWSPRYRRQELKALVFYSLNTLEWLFWKDFRCWGTGRLNKWHEITLDRRAQTELLFSKGLYLVLFVLPPFLILPVGWAIAAFFLFHVIFSWLLAIVFQIAHLTSGMEFDGVRAGDDWATHQIRTTADFATASRLTTWITGGLNHQIEHHLFPSVSHTHYPALRPIVRAAAKRQGLQCHELGGALCAVTQHFTLLKALGAEVPETRAQQAAGVGAIYE